MLGLGSLNKALNNIGKALELQSTKLVVESAKDLSAYAKENSISATDLKEAMELQAALAEL